MLCTIKIDFNLFNRVVSVKHKSEKNDNRIYIVQYKYNI